MPEIDDEDYRNWLHYTRYRAVQNRIRDAIWDEHSPLTERQVTVLTMRFGVQHTLAEVGEHLQLTRERIRQIEHESLDLLGIPRDWWKEPPNLS